MVLQGQIDVCVCEKAKCWRRRRKKKRLKKWKEQSCSQRDSLKLDRSSDECCDARGESEQPWLHSSFDHPCHSEAVEEQRRVEAQAWDEQALMSFVPMVVRSQEQEWLDGRSRLHRRHHRLSQLQMAREPAKGNSSERWTRKAKEQDR